MTPWDKDEEGLKADPPTEAELAVGKVIVDWIYDRYVILESALPRDGVALYRAIAAHQLPPTELQSRRG